VKVCTPEPVLVVMFRERPLPVEVANVCTACVLPLSEVSPPPAPASDPQKNWPVAVL
jgi:hypothetical protein